jgi:L-lactate dehydrogenase complex protein LldG
MTMEELDTSAARQRILDRIRRAQGHEARAGGAGDARAADAIERSKHRAEAPRPTVGADVIAHFEAQALRMICTVERVRAPGDAPAAIAAWLEAGELGGQAVCWPALADLPWAQAGLQVEARAPNGDDKVGITGAFAAIAETGTLMLLSGPDTPATVSLLPETHIALVPVARIVASMEDAFALLRAERGELPRAVNFISGPSRTGDIEQTIVLGAHGPCRVHLILIGEAS